MKKLLTLTLLGMFLATGTAEARGTDEVRLAIDVPYEPFVYRTPEGELAGFEIDLGNELCARADLECSGARSASVQPRDRKGQGREVRLRRQPTTW